MRINPEAKWLKPILLIARYSYAIYLTHYLIIGIVLLLLASSAAPVPVASPTPVQLWINETTAVIVPAQQHNNYTLYFITMAAPCPAGVQMQKDVQAWAAEHPRVNFQILPQGTPLGAKYNDVLSPTTVMLNSNGVVVGRWVGIFPISELDRVYNS